MFEELTWEEIEEIDMKALEGLDVFDVKANLETPAKIDLLTATMSVWAIMHTPSGKLLPESHGRYTQQEPACPSEELPRIFHDLQTARRARAQYVKGIHSLYRSGGRSFYSDDYEEYLQVEEAGHRKPDEYQVVELKLGVQIVNEGSCENV